MPETAATGLLLELSQLVSAPHAPAEVLRGLVDAAVEHLGADGAAVLEIVEDGQPRVAAARQAPGLESIDEDPKMAGADIGTLAERMRVSCRRRFDSVSTLPLVSEGDIFGALVLFSEQPGSLDEKKLRVIGGLANLAATSLAKAYQYEQLQRTFADLEASREALVRGEKLRALGRMSAGIAHDLKNVLNPLFIQLQRLERKVEGEAAVKIAAQMKQTLHRGLETVERLRVYGRQSSEGRTAACDLNTLVDEAVAMCRSLKRTEGKPEISVAHGQPPRVLVDPSELVTAIVNLVVNAVDAADGPARVTIRTGESGGGGWVEVADAGPGIAADVQARIFEPFFTTKGQQGTGLGLAIVSAFVERHGGRIEIESAPGQGTRFSLWFPPVPAIAR